MCIKLGHKHNIFYLHYFRFQNHNTQRQSFSYCQRPQPPGQKLKAYFYISILLYISSSIAPPKSIWLQYISIAAPSSPSHLSHFLLLLKLWSIGNMHAAPADCSTAAGWTLVLHRCSVFYVFYFTKWLPLRIFLCQYVCFKTIFMICCYAGPILLHRPRPAPPLQTFIAAARLK